MSRQLQVADGTPFNVYLALAYCSAGKTALRFHENENHPLELTADADVLGFVYVVKWSFTLLNCENFYFPDVLVLK